MGNLQPMPPDEFSRFMTFPRENDLWVEERIHLEQVCYNPAVRIEEAPAPRDRAFALLGPGNPVSRDRRPLRQESSERHSWGVSIGEV
jgi:hypothetical protein